MHFYYYYCFDYFIIIIIIFTFIFISWRLITLQYCSGFCHTSTWISHGFTCIPHPDPRSQLPLHPIPLVVPSAPALSTCLMHPTWAGDLFHPWYYTCFDAVLSKHPTLAFSQSPKVCSVLGYSPACQATLQPAVKAMASQTGAGPPPSGSPGDAEELFSEIHEACWHQSRQSTNVS